MKKLLLSLALSLINPSLLSSITTQNTSLITHEERKFLNTIYWNKNNIESFAVNLTDTDLDFCIKVVSKNIQILQNDLLPKNSWKKKTELMALGGLSTVLYGALGSLIAYVDCYKPHYEFITGKFKNIRISKSELKGISSLNFSLKEKKYLRRFKAENIIVTESRWWSTMYEEKESQKHLSKMSRRNKEKLTYYALQRSVTESKKDLLKKAFVPAFFITAALGVCAVTIYGIVYYQELAQKQIEECTKFHQVLNDEQERRLVFIL